MTTENYDVVIIGAGVVGCSIAYYTAKAGLRVALVDKGRPATEASWAGAGLLAPLADAVSELTEQRQSFQQLCLTGLRCFDGLDERLKDETGVDIELVKVPTLRPALSENEASKLQAAGQAQQHVLAGLEWLEAASAREIEPLLPAHIYGALLSPFEYNVQGVRLAQAYVQGAKQQGAQIFEDRFVSSLLWHEGRRVVGIETGQGSIRAEAVVIAPGAWAARWQNFTQPAIFPVKGQMIALKPRPHQPALRHNLYHPTVGYLLPKMSGSIYVGATSEEADFDKTVTGAGVKSLLEVTAQLAPDLLAAEFEQAWAGLRPASADGLPLLGASRSAPGLWWAAGHFRNGILLGPLTGLILAELLQGRSTPFGLDLNAFAPDRGAE